LARLSRARSWAGRAMAPGGGAVRGCGAAPRWTRARGDV